MSRSGSPATTIDESGTTRALRNETRSRPTDTLAGDNLGSSNCFATPKKKHKATKSDRPGTSATTPRTPIGSEPGSERKSCLTASDIAQSPPAISDIRLNRDKVVDSIAKKVLEFCRLFVPARWRTGLRGKPKSIGNLIARINDEVTAASQNRREDRHLDLYVLQDVARGCHALALAGQPKGTVFPPLAMSLHNHITVVKNFLAIASGGKLGIDTEKDKTLQNPSVDLMKLEAPSGLLPPPIGAECDFSKSKYHGIPFRTALPGRCWRASLPPKGHAKCPQW